MQVSWLLGARKMTPRGEKSTNYYSLDGVKKEILSVGCIYEESEISHIFSPQVTDFKEEASVSDFVNMVTTTDGHILDFYIKTIDDGHMVLNASDLDLTSRFVEFTSDNTLKVNVKDSKGEIEIHYEGEFCIVPDSD